MSAGGASSGGVIPGVATASSARAVPGSTAAQLAATATTQSVARRRERRVPGISIYRCAISQSFIHDFLAVGLVTDLRSR
jgi:hypothetical protein